MPSVKDMRSPASKTRFARLRKVFDAAAVTAVCGLACLADELPLARRRVLSSPAITGDI